MSTAAAAATDAEFDRLGDNIFASYIKSKNELIIIFYGINNFRNWFVFFADSSRIPGVP